MIKKWLQNSCMNLSTSSYLSKQLKGGFIIKVCFLDHLGWVWPVTERPRETRRCFWRDSGWIMQEVSSIHGQPPDLALPILFVWSLVCREPYVCTNIQSWMPVCCSRCLRASMYIFGGKLSQGFAHCQSCSMKNHVSKGIRVDDGDCKEIMQIYAIGIGNSDGILGSECAIGIATAPQFALGL